MNSLWHIACGVSSELGLTSEYESGGATLQTFTPRDKITWESTGLEVIRAAKLRVESCASSILPGPYSHLTFHSVMAMRPGVSQKNDFLPTVSADHFVGKYALTVRLSMTSIHTH
ncbi:hypothetical protein H0H81_001887 [Sphagnurus paluster]|uniref:Uncharacterized protein n=1 Tax=Sphagnurus paluster TaxID=117069 RepID=A0A9P7K2S7_9AGAR|nr:hypothetical protein H0H81_001887 [Sphagnurus paluster]